MWIVINFNDTILMAIDIIDITNPDCKFHPCILGGILDNVLCECHIVFLDSFLDTVSYSLPQNIQVSYILEQWQTFFTVSQHSIVFL